MISCCVIVHSLIPVPGSPPLAPFPFLLSTHYCPLHFPNAPLFIYEYEEHHSDCTLPLPDTHFSLLFVPFLGLGIIQLSLWIMTSKPTNQSIHSDTHSPNCIIRPYSFTLNHPFLSPVFIEFLSLASNTHTHPEYPINILANYQTKPSTRR